MNGFLERGFFGIPVTSYNVGPKQPFLYSLLTNPRTDSALTILTLLSEYLRLTEHTTPKQTRRV